MMGWGLELSRNKVIVRELAVGERIYFIKIYNLYINIFL